MPKKIVQWVSDFSIQFPAPWSSSSVGPVFGIGTKPITINHYPTTPGSTFGIGVGAVTLSINSQGTLGLGPFGLQASGHKVTIHIVPGPIKDRTNPALAPQNKTPNPPHMGTTVAVGMPDGSRTYSQEPSMALPMTGDLDPDARFSVKGPAVHAHWPRLPLGTVGMVTEGSDSEGSQRDVFLHADPRMVSVNRGFDSSYGSLVCDLDDDGGLDPSRSASLQTALRVVLRPRGIGSLSSVTTNTLSWNIGLTGCSDELGGLVTDGDAQSAIHAVANCRDGGPFDVGLEVDPHAVGVTLDGRPVNALHLSTGALFAAPADWSGKDGPLLFENARYPQDATEGTVPQIVHLLWDARVLTRFPSGGGQDSRMLPGAWRLVTYNTVYAITPDDPPPPTTPSDPPEPPTTRTPSDPPVPAEPPVTTPSDDPAQQWIDRWQNDQPGGSNFGDNSGRGRSFYLQGDIGSQSPRQYPKIAATITETLYTAQATRPQFVGDTVPDLAHAAEVSSAQRETADTAPVTMVRTAYGKQGSADFIRTQQRKQSRYKGGTASGGEFVHTPEVTFSDAGSGYQPTGVTQSESAIVHGPNVSTAWGLPDLATGGVSDGVRIVYSSTGEAIVQARVSADAAWTDLARWSKSSGLSLLLGAVMADGVNLVLSDGASGNKIGTSATQKLAFHGKTPLAQTTGWSATNGTGIKTLDVSTYTLAETKNVLATLINTLIDKGLIGA